MAIPELSIAPHPRLLCDVFALRSEQALFQTPTPEAVLAYFSGSKPAGLEVGEGVKAAVRNLLRQGGFKPTGRSKPASEYLVKAAEEGRLGSINLAVDLCNAVSLHSGLPISVIDLELATPPYRIAVVESKTSYVFNPSGQELDVTGLICFWDSLGPCGSPVKDSQRTKTRPETRHTLTVIWGDRECPEQVRLAGEFYRQLARQCGLTIEERETP